MNRIRRKEAQKSQKAAEDYEAFAERINLLSNPEAMEVLRAAKAGTLRYKELDLEDENFGLTSGQHPCSSD